jgi:hypothetical protein
MSLSKLHTNQSLAELLAYIADNNKWEGGFFFEDAYDKDAKPIGVYVGLLLPSYFTPHNLPGATTKDVKNLAECFDRPTRRISGFFVISNGGHWNGDGTYWYQVICSKKKVYKPHAAAEGGGADDEEKKSNRVPRSKLSNAQADKCVAYVSLVWGHATVKIEKTYTGKVGENGKSHGVKRQIVEEYDLNSEKCFRVIKIVTQHQGHHKLPNSKMLPARLTEAQQEQFAKQIAMGVRKAGDIYDEFNLEGLGVVFPDRLKYLAKKYMNALSHSDSADDDAAPTRDALTSTIRPDLSSAEKMLAWAKTVPGMRYCVQYADVVIEGGCKKVFLSGEEFFEGIETKTASTKPFGLEGPCECCIF